MTEPNSTPSVWHWLLPMLMGAIISLVTNQLTTYSQQKHQLEQQKFQESYDHFLAISQLTGELFATTRGLLEELSEIHTTEISTLRNEYDNMIVKINLHELQYVSMIKHHLGQSMADRFENEIINPLKSFHHLIDETLISGERLSMSEEDQAQLIQIRASIVQFNTEFMDQLLSNQLTHNNM